MKITTLIENKNTGHEELICEFGLSLLVETHGERILFDTGSTGAFLDNAQAMGISLAGLSAVVISHAHFDHSGGVGALLGRLPDARRFVLAGEYFNQKYKRTADGVRDIGSRFGREALDEAGAQISWVEGTAPLTDGVWLVKNFARTTDFERANPAFVLKEGAGYETDSFSDEVALAVQTKMGIVVVAGCSHCGVVNLLRGVSAALGQPIYGVVGGSHLVEADDARIEKTIEELRALGLVRCWLSHCTGEVAGERFAAAFGDGYVPNHTGNVIEIPE